MVARWWPGGAPGEPPEAVQLGVPHGLQPRRPGGRRAAEQGGGVAVVVLPQHHLRRGGGATTTLKYPGLWIYLKKKIKSYYCSDLPALHEMTDGEIMVEEILHQELEHPGVEVVKVEQEAQVQVEQEVEGEMEVVVEEVEVDVEEVEVEEVEVEVEVGVKGWLGPRLALSTSITAFMLA